jgi:hypothetical protein
MAFKCGTYKPITNIKTRSSSAGPTKKNVCLTNDNFEKMKYRKCKFGNIRVRDKDLMPLGGTNFVEILKKQDEKRVAKMEFNSDRVKSYQRTKMKSSYLCSEFCGMRKYESGPLNDKNKDFKITQSK